MWQALLTFVVALDPLQFLWCQHQMRWSHRCPFWLIWLKNRGVSLVYLVVQSTTRETHLFFPKNDTYSWSRAIHWHSPARRLPGRHLRPLRQASIQTKPGLRGALRSPDRPMAPWPRPTPWAANSGEVCLRAEWLAGWEGLMMQSRVEAWRK